MKPITKAQRRALYRIYERVRHEYQPGELPTYREFRKTAQTAFYDDCLMVPFAGMLLGIETDGYTHS